ncbi:MAG: hypothetical protein LBQ60_19905 [Bacteroidales bacterium]|nr:hypothetical protein [Bacteroidales bacterium]
MKVKLIKTGTYKRLTFWSWLLILICLILAILLFFRKVYGFLAENKPVETKLYVIEGYVPDFIIKQAVEYITIAGFDKIICSGLPISKGILCSEYANYSDYNASIVLSEGVDPLQVISAPAVPVERDRTYAMALSVKNKLVESGYNGGKINLICSNVHGRRSRILFEKAFGDTWEIGVISFPEGGYPSDRWWRSSEGVKDILTEVFSYVYTILFFHP